MEAHSAVDPDNYIAICSSEKVVQGRYEQYSQEQLKACEITGDPVRYFAITPAFVEECMSGEFEDTVIILMSCNGLNQNYTKTAEAFIEKGVKIFISWNQWINSSQNDHAITLLLQHLINENKTVREAVREVNYYAAYWGAMLDYYPITADNYRISYYRQSGITGNAALIADAFLENKNQS